MKKISPKKAAYRPRYSVWDELTASPTEPMPEAKRNHQLTRMYEGLHALEQADNPSTDDWRVVSDAVNLVETLVLDMKICEDNDGLLEDAVKALADAGRRHIKTGANIRLDAQGIQAVRSVLADYADLLGTLPERTMMRCHRLTEKRLREILEGRKNPHDVEIVDL